MLHTSSLSGLPRSEGTVPVFKPRATLRRSLAPIIVAVVAASCAFAAPKVGGPDELGISWATIGAPGNRHTEAWELPNTPPLDPPLVNPMGGVKHRYRMATTEVTNGLWFQYVQAYRPYVGSEFASQSFTGGAIIFMGFESSGLPRYTLSQHFENTAVRIGWRHAARFVNWLHNGTPTGDDLTEAAFTQGVYDAATFTTNPDGTINDNTTAAKGAKYWIPTQDEWIKAAYYDPNRYGEGEGGYWPQPNGQVEPLVPGFPGEPGAQTSAGIHPKAPGPGTGPIPVGAYPDVNAPWGLLDVSGGAPEWTSTLGYGPVNIIGMFSHGTANGTVMHEYFDMIDIFGLGRPHDQRGVRLASPIPNLGTAYLLVAFPIYLSNRRRL